MLGFLQDVRPGDVVPYQAAMGFSVDAPGVGPLRLPVKTQGELPVPAAPEVSVAGIDWQSPSLTNIGGVINLAIKNKNSFEMDLANMALDLGLGGTKVASTGIEDAVHFDPKGSSTLRIPVRLSPLSLGVGILSLVKGNEADYSINGKFDAFTPYGEMLMPFAGAGRTKQSPTDPYSLRRRRPGHVRNTALSRPEKPAVPLKFFAIFLVILIGFVALAPTLFSGVIRGKVEDAIRAKVNGEVSIRSLSVGWLSGIEAKGVEITADGAPRPSLEIDRLKDRA